MYLLVLGLSGRLTGPRSLSLNHNSEFSKQKNQRNLRYLHLRMVIRHLCFLRHKEILRALTDISERLWECRCIHWLPCQKRVAVRVPVRTDIEFRYTPHISFAYYSINSYRRWLVTSRTIQDKENIDSIQWDGKPTLKHLRYQQLHL